MGIPEKERNSAANQSFANDSIQRDQETAQGIGSHDQDKVLQQRWDGDRKQHQGDSPDNDGMDNIDSVGVPVQLPHHPSLAIREESEELYEDVEYGE